MKGFVCLGLAAAMAGAMLLTSCQVQPGTEAAAGQTSETGESARTGTLLMDFTAGSNVEDVRPVELDTGIALTDLCSTLEEVTGIQFAFTVATDETGCTVTWQEDSALALEEPWPLGDFDLSQPYQGSAWYCEQCTGWDTDSLDTD